MRKPTSVELLTGVSMPIDIQKVLQRFAEFAKDEVSHIQFGVGMPLPMLHPYCYNSIYDNLIIGGKVGTIFDTIQHCRNFKAIIEHSYALDLKHNPTDNNTRPILNVERACGTAGYDWRKNNIVTFDISGDDIMFPPFSKEMIYPSMGVIRHTANKEGKQHAVYKELLEYLHGFDFVNWNWYYTEWYSCWYHPDITN